MDLCAGKQHNSITSALPDIKNKQLHQRVQLGGNDAFCLVVGKLLVRFLAPPSCMSKSPWARYRTPNLQMSSCPSVYECVCECGERSVDCSSCVPNVSYHIRIRWSLATCLISRWVTTVNKAANNRLQAVTPLDRFKDTWKHFQLFSFWPVSTVFQAESEHLHLWLLRPKQAFYLNRDVS